MQRGTLKSFIPTYLNALSVCARASKRFMQLGGSTFIFMKIEDSRAAVSL